MNVSAELWGLREDLRVTKARCLDNIEVEMDAETVVKVVNNNDNVV